MRGMGECVCGDDANAGYDEEALRRLEDDPALAEALAGSRD